LAGSGIALMRQGEAKTPTIAGWLGTQLKPGSKVGVDPKVISIAQFRRLRSDLEHFDLLLIAFEENLVDRLWKDKPEDDGGPVEVHPVKYAGESVAHKLSRVRKSMAGVGATAHVLAALDSIAWLFNIRGTDVENNPVVIAYAIVTAKRATLFTDQKKIDRDVKAALGKTVTIQPYEKFRDALKKLAQPSEKVWLDPVSMNEWVAELLCDRAKVYMQESPISMFKACKNAAELAGMKAAHVRDGVAMVKFLCWLEREVKKQRLTEVSVADKLAEFREQDPMYKGPSFDTIAGYAAHGAIIHYCATARTNAKLQPKGIFLLDSGGQYLDGTTDITRVICFSAPTAEQKDQYTRVLKGHLAIVLTPFPAGTAGRQIDTLARKPLWDAGLNYGHGTGHGVGAYLSVHEGPQSISPTRDTGVALAPGMVLSNEPGYYKPGRYGFRIENLVYVIEDKQHSNGTGTFYCFESLTMCPIETKLISKSLLAAEELRYLNAYHAKVRKTLTPFLEKAEAAWLARATRPI
jgi:Xaa-Pro aminopeptidase